MISVRKLEQYVREAKVGRAYPWMVLELVFAVRWYQRQLDRFFVEAGHVEGCDSLRGYPCNCSAATRTPEVQSCQSSKP